MRNQQLCRLQVENKCQKQVFSFKIGFTFKEALFVLEFVHLFHGNFHLFMMPADSFDENSQASLAQEADHLIRSDWQN